MKVISFEREVTLLRGASIAFYNAAKAHGELENKMKQGHKIPPTVFENSMKELRDSYEHLKYAERLIEAKAKNV